MPTSGNRHLQIASVRGTRINGPITLATSVRLASTPGNCDICKRLPQDRSFLPGPTLGKLLVFCDEFNDGKLNPLQPVQSLRLGSLFPWWSRLLCCLTALEGSNQPENTPKHGELDPQKEYPRHLTYARTADLWEGHSTNFNSSQ